MLALMFSNAARPLRRVLCLGAHSDDIEIGCGGSILRLVQEHPDAAIEWVVFSASPQRRGEALASAEAFLAGAAHKTVTVHGFRDGYFPYIGADVKDVFEQLKRSEPPDLIFTHYRHDLHQDHRLLSELARNTFRDHLILEYEIPKYDGDLGAPNTYIHLSEEMAARKTALLLEHFPTQAGRDWFTADTFNGLMRLRGVESRAPEGKAEAFYAHKLVIG